MLELNKIYNVNCLEGMKQIDDESIDMIFCDLPYGVTARNYWDSIIPPEPLWAEYELSLIHIQMCIRDRFYMHQQAVESGYKRCNGIGG